MKIGFFAHDVGPHNMLKLVAEAAEAAGHEVLLVPAQVPRCCHQCGRRFVQVQHLGLRDLLLSSGRRDHSTRVP